MIKKFLILVSLVLISIPAFAQEVDTVWVRRYNGPGNSEDKAYALAVDGSGNVYVTGYSVGSGTNDDYATIKYYPDGDTAWVRRYDGPISFDDRAYAIAVDGSGNVYVTGFSTETLEDYLTIKYYSNGDIAWMKRYDGTGNGEDKARAIAVDGSGNVYVTGYSEGSGTDWDYATIKYYSNGDIAWVKRYNGTGNGEDEARAIAVDGSGNVYVTGRSARSGASEDYATIKYYPDGDTAWVRSYVGDDTRAIAVDGSGNVCVTGEGNAYNDMLTIKHYPNGDTAWVREYDGPENRSDRATDLAVDESRNVYVTGHSYHTHGGETTEDYLTIKYYPNGDTAWARRYNGPANDYDYAEAIAVDGCGNVYVTGGSKGDWYWEYATIRYDANGNTIWTKRDVSGSWAQDIVVDGSGYVYVTGYVGTDFATIKYWQNTSPTSFSLISPIENDSVIAPVTFYWETSMDSDPNDTLRFDLYLSSSVVFDPDSTTIHDSLSDTTLTDSLDVGHWYWKVKAYDNRGAETWSNEIWTFYVELGFLYGDANGDGVINSADVVYLINYLFKGGPAPVALEAGDVNCDGIINSADVVYLINYLFKGGPPPGCP